MSPDAAPRRSDAAVTSPLEQTDHGAAGRIGELVPDHVRALLEHLWDAGHAAYVVGGSLRDAILGLPAADWDVATDARPERLLALFPGSHYENRFGTVLVETPRGAVEVTTFRRDHRYGDHRRPEAVTFSDTLEEDLSRRDFTVNALAWGRAGTAAAPRLVDTSGGLADLRAGVLRAVGDPARRFDEDALRLVRAARLAGQLGFEIEPATLAAAHAAAHLVRYVSNERIGHELRRILSSARPSRGLVLLDAIGILPLILPELASEHGVPQHKVGARDCWEHTLVTVDAAAQLAPHGERLALAALLHDVGKPATLSDGHFYGHERVGADLADRILRRLAVPRAESVPVVRLVREHMFNYRADWSDAAVRRFIARVGVELLDDLLLLREADNLGSGLSAADASLDEFRARIRGELERGVPLGTRNLAVDGHDLQRELGIEPGPLVGTLLQRLLDSVVADPTRNTTRQLLMDAREWLPQLQADLEAAGGARHPHGSATGAREPR